jgi:hypothetical protein
MLISPGCGGDSCLIIFPLAFFGWRAGRSDTRCADLNPTT